MEEDWKVPSISSEATLVASTWSILYSDSKVILASAGVSQEQVEKSRIVKTDLKKEKERQKSFWLSILIS